MALFAPELLPPGSHDSTSSSRSSAAHCGVVLGMTTTCTYFAFRVVDLWTPNAESIELLPEHKCNR